MSKFRILENKLLNWLMP